MTAQEPDASQPGQDIPPTRAATPNADVDAVNANIRAIAETTSYTGRAAAAGCLFLLPITWPFGFWLAWQWRKEARHYQSLVGHELPGQGCLGLTVWFGVVSLIIMIGLWALFFVGWGVGSQIGPGVGTP